ncbi:TlpA family protein disulfide reductase [Oryzifoliimicrobium ureilyticus]|uniref:TlpA family protein disulfide reductase n=1 Tax=Oryzifoliimicrobium ureilyticus TaxID=3113724 RepID=UPI003076279C
MHDDSDKRIEATQTHRRAILKMLLVMGAVPLRFVGAHAAEHNNPPVFSTIRHQFTMIEPAFVMPAVSLADRTGRAKVLGPAKGKVMLLNFWATWCPACRTDLPMLERFSEVMGEGVAVAAVSTDSHEDRSKIEPFLDDLKIKKLPIYLDPDGRLGSSSSDIKAPFSLRAGMPVTYLIQPSCVVAGYMLGLADWQSPEGQNLLSYYAQR